MPASHLAACFAGCCDVKGEDRPAKSIHQPCSLLVDIVQWKPVVFQVGGIVVRFACSERAGQLGIRLCSRLLS